MTTPLVQDILSLVEKPSRYLGTEINTARKNLQEARLHFCLAFPDLYEVGTSHFGMQILYNILNRHPKIAAERVFAPAIDMAHQLRKTGTALFSLESRTPLHQMDIIGFSLLYELNYTNILGILDLSGIPFYAAERDERFPLIIAGGPCTCNPEPVADFFDAIVVGDGETVVVKLSEAWMAWKQSGSSDKHELLRTWLEIEGVYVPSMFTVRYDENGFQTVSPAMSGMERVVRRIVEPDLEHLPFPEAPVVPYGRPIHDRLRLEVARGCTRGCRFCQAGMIYRPVRERSAEKLLSIASHALPRTGYEDISLLSLSTGDYSCLSYLMQCLMEQYARQHIAVSLPSVRAGTLTAELMHLIKQVRKTGFTIAPEAGTQRLRDVINKNLTEEEIIDTVSQAFEMGWQVMKLYFMTGLPTETEDDREGIVDLVNTLRKGRIQGKRFRKINVSVTTFIPKPHVPFQWASQVPLERSRETIRKLKQDLKLPGVTVKWQIPEVSLLEGLFARGDRRLSRLIVAAYQRGCQFDSWTDHFQWSRWQGAIQETGIDSDFFVNRQRDVNEPLPWDHIDIGVTKKYLAAEWDHAIQGNITGDCRNGICNQCGVCDFQTIAPRTAVPAEPVCVSGNPEPVLPSSSSYVTYQVQYSKKGQARFFGHLEMVNAIFRAIQRAEIPVLFSEGFHPKPRISFDNPIPLGIESQSERFTIRTAEYIKPNDIVTKLNTQLPDGIRIQDCFVSNQSARFRQPSEIKYEIALSQTAMDIVKSYLIDPPGSVTMEYANKKGKLKKINLADMVRRIEILDVGHIRIAVQNGPEKTVRPLDILTHMFAMSEQDARQARIVKILSEETNH